MESEIQQARPSRKRLQMMVVAGGLVALAGLLYYYFWWYRPVGSGGAGPAVPAHSFRGPWTTQEVLLVGLGDSVTAGFGAGEGYSYFERLLNNPPDEFAEMRGINLSAVFPRLRSTNLAMSGSTSLHLIKNQLSRLPRQPTNVLGVVVITTGGNDIIHDYGRTPPAEGAMYGASLAQAGPWLTNFAQRLNLILDEVERRFPGGCRVFLANIYDPTDGLGDADHAGLPAWPDAMQILQAYNAVIAQVSGSRKTVRMVNIREPFLGHGIHCTQFWRSFYHKDDPHYWFHENLEDPNERGYDALRRLYLQAMSRVFRPVNERP